jgi:hypothetical protein
MSTAEADPGTGVLRPAHPGAWTEEAYLALPEADRVQPPRGAARRQPARGPGHRPPARGGRGRRPAAVAAALPPGLEVTGPVALRLAPGRILVPDLVVAAPVADDESGEVRDSSVALVVVDVVGRGNGVADRWFKPQLYAGCRIPYALLVDHDEPFAVGSMLIGGRFHEYAEAGPGGVLRVDEPFALELDLATLVAGAAAPSESVAEPGAGLAAQAPQQGTGPSGDVGGAEPTGPELDAPRPV